MKPCACGCGQIPPNTTKRFISGHNLRVLKRTTQHCRRIAEAQRLAWQTKRRRMEIGSVYRDFHGYIRVKVIAGKGRWKLQHHLVMEQKIGRKIRNGEIVHHMNGCRDDNRPENLVLCRNKSHHATVHRSLDLVVSQLIEQGIIAFSDGKYVLVS